MKPCRCTHTEDDHEHYHAGTYCGKCKCSAYQRKFLWFWI